MPDGYAQFTRHAQQALVLAEEAARRSRHRAVGAEHLLLGLVAEPETIAGHILADLDLSPERVRTAVEDTMVVGDAPAADVPDDAEIALAPEARRAIELAIEESRRLGHIYVGTEHLLLGVLRGPTDPVSAALAPLDLSVERVREEVVRLTASAGRQSVRAIPLSSRRQRPATGDLAEPKGNVITCRITDRDLKALDALVESGIRSTRSDAAAWLISAGIEAHGDLFEKIYATIEQIRQLRSEAQQIARQHSPAGLLPQEGAE